MAFGVGIRWCPWLVDLWAACTSGPCESARSSVLSPVLAGWPPAVLSRCPPLWVSRSSTLRPNPPVAVWPGSSRLRGGVDRPNHPEHAQWLSAGTW